MWCAVAIGRTTLRALRQTRAWTHRASAQPGSRACPTGGHSLDGVLGVARGCRSGRDRCSKHDLRRREEWARIVALVMGFIALLSVPIGTALGVYTLWVLLPRQSDDEYKALAQAA